MAAREPGARKKTREQGGLLEPASPDADGHHRASSLNSSPNISTSFYARDDVLCRDRDRQRKKEREDGKRARKEGDWRFLKRKFRERTAAVVENGHDRC